MGGELNVDLFTKCRAGARNYGGGRAVIRWNESTVEESLRVHNILQSNLTTVISSAIMTLYRDKRILHTLECLAERHPNISHYYWFSWRKRIGGIFKRKAQRALPELARLFPQTFHYVFTRNRQTATGHTSLHNRTSSHTKSDREQQQFGPTKNEQHKKTSYYVWVV